jgi:signal transduction histidine kinase
MPVDQTKLLTRILELIQNLSAETDLEVYIRSILSAATELTGSETAAIVEYDEIRREFNFKYVPWFHDDSIKLAKIPLEGNAVGSAFQQVKPILINDVKNDPRYYSKSDDLAGFTTRSFLAVPLRLQDKAVGVFELRNKMIGEDYSDADIHILESLASLAVSAMQNDLLTKNIQASLEESRSLDQLKNEFIAITSHELRTPLGLIIGHATFLRELVGNEFAEQVDAIIRGASRLKEIIENLSDVDNFQTGGSLLRSRKVSMARVIEDASASFQELAVKKGVRLHLEIEPTQDLWLDIDGSKIAIVLSNLLKNAVAFTNEGGQITIRAERLRDFIKVSVKDNGMGIPAKDLAHVFDRFYQVESHLTRRHGGMGLGLSVAKVMIEIHGGQIWAESMEGVGSTFIFLLPVNGKRIETDPPQSISV